jgi:GNAT superfamily N-acetyltransferase
MRRKYSNNLFYKIYESFNDSSEVIDINIYDESGEDFVGSANGILHKDKERLLNLLKMEKASKDAFEYFNNLDENAYMPISILQNVNIFEESRGKGYGDEALDKFIDKSYEMGAKTILLIADTGEDNKFNIVEWYKKNGFTQIGLSGVMPIMVMEQ